MRPGASVVFTQRAAGLVFKGFILATPPVEHRGMGKNLPTIPGLGVDLPELRRARALWQANRFDEALALFKDAAERHPQNVVALIDASRALGARFEIAHAEKMVGRLLKLAGNRAELIHLAGQTYRMIFRPEQAMRCFEKVLGMSRQIPDAYLELAVLYERRHRLDEALAWIDECLRCTPDYFEAKLFQGRLLRRKKYHTQAEDVFRSLTENDKAVPPVRAQAWAEIAQMLDQQDQFPGAMAAMMKCKEIMRQFEGPALREAEFVLRHLGRLADELTAENFRDWSLATNPLPQRNAAVLTGFPRSGTTLLEQVLDSHSGLVSSDEREAFARDIFPAMWLSPATPAPTARALSEVPLDKLSHLRGRYFDYMEAALNEPIGGRVHLDKNPPLTLVLPGFLRLLPETKVLVALRDPRDVVVSCFMQFLPLNPNSVCFLSLERTAQRYANDMAVWRQLRERIASPWLEVKYEETVANLEREARRALEFLGLPWEDSILKYRERLKEKVVGSPTYEAVSQPLYTRAIGRWRNYEEFLQPFLPILKPSLKAFGY
jgi:tetratricopeptide (TPR) repeat protein